MALLPVILTVAHMYRGSIRHKGLGLGAARSFIKWGSLWNILGAQLGILNGES